jgi:hypothetical protein
MLSGRAFCRIVRVTGKGPEMGVAAECRPSPDFSFSADSRWVWRAAHEGSGPGTCLAQEINRSPEPQSIEELETAVAVIKGTVGPEVIRQDAGAQLLSPFPEPCKEDHVRLVAALPRGDDGIDRNDVKRIDVLRVVESPAAAFLLSGQAEGEPQ